MIHFLKNVMIAGGLLQIVAFGAARFSDVQSLDSGAIAFLNAGFVELHRKIAESIARLNSFEYGAQP